MKVVNGKQKKERVKDGTMLCSHCGRPIDYPVARQDARKGFVWICSRCWKGEK